MSGSTVVVYCSGPECDGMIRMCGYTGTDPAADGVALAVAVGWVVDETGAEIEVRCPHCARPVAS